MIEGTYPLVLFTTSPDQPIQGYNINVSQLLKIGEEVAGPPGL